MSTLIEIRRQAEALSQARRTKANKPTHVPMQGLFPVSRNEQPVMQPLRGIPSRKAVWISLQGNSKH